MKKNTKTYAKITPLHDRVLIKETPKEDKKTSSGIIIPESVKDGRMTKQGTVIAVGKGKFEDGKLVPLSISVGDKVLFSWGDDVVIDDEEYIVVKEGEIIAIVK